MSYASEVLADNPIWYVKLDEASGTTATDYSVNALPGTYVNTPTLGSTSGPLGGTTAATFASASTEEVTRADDVVLRYADTFTLEAWVKRANQALYQGIVEKGPASGYLRISNANKLNLIKTGQADIVHSVGTIGDDVWTHVAATKSGSTMNLYINGVDDTGSATNATCLSTTDTLRVAQEGTGAEYMNGSLAHVAIYTTALSAARIAAHYAAAFGTGTIGSFRTDRIRSRRTSW